MLSDGTQKKGDSPNADQTSDKNDDAKSSSSSSTRLDSLIQRLAGGPQCTAALNCGGLYSVDDDAVPLPLEDQVVSSLLGDIQFNDETLQTEALERLYRLTNGQNKSNRIPLVGTRKWQVVQVLVACLDTTEAAETRRLACLTLNNLSIPFENKAILILGPDSEALLHSLVGIIQRLLPECYLCCICLYNLSILEDAQPTLLHFGTDNQNSSSSLSLLQAIQHMFQTYVPILHKNSKSWRRRNGTSVEGEAVRWGTGLLRNLTMSQEGACKIALETELPRILVNILQHSTTTTVSTSSSLGKWTQDSLEDMCLSALLNLAKYDESVIVLQQLPTREALAPIIGQGGIHDMRASMIDCKLQEKAK